MVRGHLKERVTNVLEVTSLFMVLLGGRSSVWAWGRASSHTFLETPVPWNFPQALRWQPQRLCSSSCSTWSSAVSGTVASPHVLGPRP